MVEQGSATPTASEGRKDWHYLVLLLLLVLPLRGWLLYNTEVAARDSIGFIRYALDFEKKSWKDTLLAHQQHPGYPLAIWAVSQPVRALAGTDPATMRFAAQLTSTLAALLLLVPMYYLGKELFDRQVGFWAALLFQYLPVSGHHLSDGISEALFLLCVAMALWRGVRAIRTHRPLEFAWAGLFGGLAYLTRPEGALVVLALGVTLVGMQLLPRRRTTWPRFLACGMSLSVAAAVVGGIFVFTIGKLTSKPAPGIIGDSILGAHEVGVAHGPLLAAFFPRSDDFGQRLYRSLRAMGIEFGQGFHYVAWIPAVLGLWWNRRRLREDAAFWALGAYCGFHAVILLLLAMVESYVSDRHMMPLVLCGTYFAVDGMRTLAQASRRLYAGGKGTAPAWLTGAAVAVFLLVCMPKTMARMHSNRTGNHAAGLWLAQQRAVGDIVNDDHAYAHYYSGLVFEEGKESPLPQGATPKCFVVFTRSKDAEVGGERRVKEDEVSKRAPLVYHWPESRTAEEARVVIYVEPRDRKKNPWPTLD